MPKPGIKIISDVSGTGPEVKKGDIVRIRYDIRLNHGEFVAQDQEVTYRLGDRAVVAGFRYGIEGMCSGGKRKFRASAHLCYRDQEVPNVPKNAALVFEIKSLEILP